MTRDDESKPKERDPGSASEKAPEPAPAAEYPTPPDPARVRELREQVRASRQARSSGRRLDPAKQKRAVGDRARDLGAYTLIPMLMLAGPAVGYVLGLLVQRRWGGEPWGAVVGMLVGLVAGFRQVFLLLARFSKKDQSNESGQSDKDDTKT